jgi:hypothetical protein
MPSSDRFFEKIGLLAKLGKGLIALAVLGLLTGFFTTNQSLLTWSAIAGGVGLALIFFREAFRPKVGFGDESKEDKDSDNDKPAR